MVPFPWESELSAVHQPKDAPKVGRYRRTFQVPDSFPREDRVRLRFGAVDHRANIWVSGKHVVVHEVGYTPSEADGKNVVVRVFGPTDPSLPAGKQVGWYTMTSDIWQTVWLESRPKTYIMGFTITTEINLARATISVPLPVYPPYDVSVSVRSNDPTVPGGIGKNDVMSINGRAGAIRAMISVNVHESKLWTLETPHLYDIVLELEDKDGKVIDSSKTYFGLRTIARGKYGDEPLERILLNGKPNLAS